MIFKDRVDAGRKLALGLTHYKREHPVIYALPRGGVVLGAEIARSLDAPLDLIIVRKVGHLFSPEYAIAAVAEDGRGRESTRRLQEFLHSFSIVVILSVCGRTKEQNWPKWQRDLESLLLIVFLPTLYVRASYLIGN